MIVSTELDEVIELADRIAVLYKGKLVGIVPAGTGRDVLGLMMAGVSADEARTDAAGKHPAPAPESAENPADTPATYPAPAAPSVQEPSSGAVGDHHD
jgi:simple sugar transport system ATP-binding protein